MLLSAAALLLLAVKYEPSFVVRGLALGDRIIVEAKLDGRNAHLMVDTGSEFTIVDDGRSQSRYADAEIEAGGQKLAKLKVGRSALFLLKVLKEEIEAAAEKKVDIVGVLGRDVLSKYAVGLDYEEVAVTLWKSEVPRDAAEAWVRAKQTRSPVEIPLVARQGQWCVTAAGGDAKLVLMFDTGTSWSSLYSSSSKALASEAVFTNETVLATGKVNSEMRLAPRLTIGSVQVAWWPFVQVPDSSRALSGGKAGTDGVLAPPDLRSSRILLDPRRSTLTALTPLPGSALTQLTGLPFTVDKDRITFGPISAAGRHAAALKFSGDEVESIAGVESRSLRDALFGAQKSTLLTVAELFRAVQGAYKINIRHEGKTESIDVNSS